MSRPHHESSCTHTSFTSLSVDRTEKGFKGAKRVLACIMQVGSGHLSEALACGLGYQTYGGFVSALAVAPQEQSRAFLNVDVLLSRLRTFGYGNDNFGPLVGHLSSLIRKAGSRYMCDNPYCPYGEERVIRDANGQVASHNREEAYSPHDEYRLIWSDGRITASFDGLCLNCIDDRRRWDEEC